MCGTPPRLFGDSFGANPSRAPSTQASWLSASLDPRSAFRAFPQLGSQHVPQIRRQTLVHARSWEGPHCVRLHPEAFEDVEKIQYEAFGRNPLFVEATTDVLGQGVFAISGPLWHHQRKTASRLISTQMIQHNMDVVVPDKCKELMKRLDAAASEENPIDRVVSLKWRLDLFTMDVFCKVGFGIDMHKMETEKIIAMLEALQRSSARIVGRILEPSWFWKLRRDLNIGAERQFTKDMECVNDMICGFIAPSIEEKAQRDQVEAKEDEKDSRMDLISLYLDQDAADNGKDAPFDPKKQRDFLVSFLAAGQDTTSTSMSWFVVMINRYPKVLDKNSRQDAGPCEW